MEVRIFTHSEFERNFKRLRKKYKSLVADYCDLIKSLKSNPVQGMDLGNGVRKIRMQISSKGKGKSGGARIITYNEYVNDDGSIDITLLTIYDKNEISSVTDQFIRNLVESI